MTEPKRARADDAVAGGPARLLLLDPADNVLIAVRSIAIGDPLPIDGDMVAAQENIPVGHKIARTDLGEGEKALKYGAPIGTTTCAIPRGAHVHAHNLRSNYIATHSREDDAS